MIKFMKYYWVYFIISALAIAPGAYSLVRWGVNPSIDFTGGTLLEVAVEPNEQGFNKDKLEELAKEIGIEVASVRLSGSNTYLLQASPFDQETSTILQQKVASVSAQVSEKRFETLGPTLGSEMLRKALVALGVASATILLFVWKQFSDKKYGICAILAMFHDTLIVFGGFSLLGHFYNVEVDTLFMTALLTILSFSVHDTIVVYDRIRESLRSLPKVPYQAVVNKAINETLGRSVNNSMTIVFMLLALYLLGGETIRWFVLALLVGTVSGTYSSTFVAAPLLVLWDKWFGKKK
ncbi:MAG: protein translocase subunit SecF [Patescibacteria group bacterium]|jgi:preprotein translocase subunit SecF